MTRQSWRAGTPRIDGARSWREVPARRDVPPQAARLLRKELGHDALHVGERGLRGTDDREVAAYGRSEQRAVVTENVADFATEANLVLVCVLKVRLPIWGAQASVLAQLLDRWALANPEPYVGHHWPR